MTGVHAYSQKQIEPGDELQLRVSSTVPYELSIVRLGSDPDSMDKDITLFSTSSEAIPQAIYPGSYIHISKGLSNVKALTFECWVRAFDIQSRQGLITQTEEKDELSYGIYLNAGNVELQIGNHILQTPPGYIIQKKWHHVVATWDGSTTKIHFLSALY
ncbi:MAG: LamG domain-containing protein [Robiginitomaculum sp.]|nr:LamG domain-containing protein [Robiginitomaculum sp.]